MPDLSARWRAHTGQLAWPTLLLAGLSLAAWVGGIAAHAVGLLPSAAAALLGTAAVYVSFTPLHEATHGNVGGRADRAWLDTVVGTACALPMLGAFPAFRAIHLQHHAHTNDPDEDPDLHVAGPLPRALLGALRTLPHYHLTYFTRLSRKTAGSRAALPGVLVTFALILLALALTAAAGFGGTVLWAVVVPAWLGTALLALAFDWLPHHPHAVQGRFHDTRALPSRALEVLLLGQNLHLVHHLWPRVPWFRYGPLFREVRPLLEARGAPIGVAPASRAAEVTT